MRDSRVLSKLIALVLVAAATAAALLAVRQRRVEAAHDLAKIQAGVAEHDQALWRLRLEIASRVRPRSVAEMASRVGPMEPIMRQYCAPGKAVRGSDRRIAAAPEEEPAPTGRAHN